MSEIAIDPTCNMEVTIGQEAAKAEVNGKMHYFCAVGCKVKFLAQNEIGVAEPKPTKRKFGFFGKKSI